MGRTAADTVAESQSFYCPLPSAVHPQAAEAERLALDWIDRSGFCRTPTERAWVAATHSADFYARFVPEADLDRLWITACWVYWGFAFDDARCDEGPLATDPATFADMAASVQRALEVPGPLACADPYAAAVHDLGERFRACAGPAQNRRFHNAHRAWLTGVQWQIGNRAGGRMPGLDDYLTMRLHSAGGEPTYAMLEIADGLDVPGHEMDSPAVYALTEMAILVAALDNDRYSQAKEASRRQTGQNIVSVLMAERRCSPAEALDEAVALRDTVLQRFLTLRDRVVRRADAPLRQYLAGLGHGIRGNIEWGVRVPRYVSLNDATTLPDVPDTPPEVHWTDTPRTGTLALERLPSIAWWWQDLA
ncbi:terpene synthase family protein [Streptomyces coeruleoprunus]|uniref:Terpene synthase n=1 Tax=Streptomyces coeruleoprunus TaxID=285563 RepID=A0ABV9XFT9_9ACTN